MMYQIKSFLQNKSDHLNHCVVSWACSNPRDRNSNFLFDEFDIVDSLFGEVLWFSDFGSVSVPSFDSFIDYFNVFDIFQRAWKNLNFPAVNFIGDSNFDFFESVEDIQFGDVDRGVAVDQMSVSDQIKV